MGEEAEFKDAAPSGSLADRILGTDHVLREIVTVREWEDVKLEVRGLSVREVALAGMRLDRLPKERRFELATPVYVVAGVYDPDTGEKAFNDSHLEKLSDEPQVPMEFLAGAVLRLSGMAPPILGVAVSAYLEALEGEDEQATLLALGRLRKAANGEATPTGEANGA